LARLLFRRGAYYSDFRSNGKRIQRFLHTNKQIAHIKLGELLKQFRSEKRGHGNYDISFPAFKKKYLEYSRGQKRPETFIRDQAAINALEKFDDPPINYVKQITPEILERWRGSRKNLSPATINRDMAAVKAMLKKGIDWGYVEAGKWDWDSVKRLKAPKGRLVFYSKADFKRILDNCTGIWKTIALLGGRAGLRRGEIYMLEWSDIEFDRNRIHIEQKEGWVPKDYERRTIPLFPELKTWLLTARRHSRWVIADSSGERPALAVMSTYFGKIVRRLNLPGGLHTLRHTFASHLAQDGVSLYTLAKWLGHENVETTQIYAKLSPDSMDSEALKVSPL